MDLPTGNKTETQHTTEPEWDDIFAAQCGMFGPNWKFHRNRYREKIEKNPGDCGLDLYPTGISKVQNCAPDMSVIWVGTGLHMVIPVGYYGRLIARSSVYKKLGVFCHLLEGTIDAGYTGEYHIRILAPLTPIRDLCNTIRRMSDNQVAMAQVIVTPYAVVQGVKMTDDEITMTKQLMGRGDKGYGSTDQSPNASLEA